MTHKVARSALVLLLAALILRLAAGCWWQSRQESLGPGRSGTDMQPGQPGQPGRFFFGDSESYWQLGQCIAHGRPFSFGDDHARVFRTPGYPAMLAPIFRIAGDDASPLWGRAESAALETISVAAVGLLAATLFGSRAGIVAMAAAAVYPESIAAGAFVLSEAAFAPWMLLQLGLWILAWNAPSTRRAAAGALASGIAGGVATLVRPSWLLFTPFAIALAIVFSPLRKRHLALGAAALAGLLVTMSPWWVRNYCVTGHLVTTTLQAGASLYDGLNPSADGGSNMDFVAPITADEKRRMLEEGDAPQNLEYRLDCRLGAEAVAWAKAHPGRVAGLAAVKFLRMWNVWPNEPSLSRWPARLAIAATYMPMLLLGIAGAWRWRRLGWPVALCLLPAVYFTMLHVVFVSSLRYRHPAMLGLIVLAAGAIAASKPKEITAQTPKT